MAEKPPGYGIPAIHSNMFHVTLTDTGQARLIFQDAIQGKDGADVAHIAMSAGDLESLVQVAGEVLKKYRARKN